MRDGWWLVAEAAGRHHLSCVERHVSMSRKRLWPGADILSAMCHPAHNLACVVCGCRWSGASHHTGWQCVDAVGLRPRVLACLFFCASGVLQYRAA